MPLRGRAFPHPAWFRRALRLDAGVLEVGKPADITVFSTTEEWTVDRNKFYTKGKVSPFDGMTVIGKAKLTVVNGEVVMKDGVVLR